MFKRVLGGLAALTVVGVADAQTPTFNPRMKPAFVPAKAAPDIQQTAMKSDAALPAALPQVAAPALPAVAGPMVAAPAANLYPDLPCAADVAASCGESCGPAMDCLCGPPGRFWLGAEYLFWGTKGNNLVPIATGAPAGTARNVAGTIGGPGTTYLIGNNTVNDEFRSGFRAYGGLWLDQAQRLGLEADYFFLGTSTYRASAGSDGTNIIMRPFTDNTVRNDNGTYSVVAPYQNTQLVSFPNTLRGTIDARSSSDFTGFGANLVKNLFCSDVGRLDFLLGYRFLYLKDVLDINEDLTGINPNAGTRFQVNDNFRTQNYFNGGVLGLAYERRFSHFFLNVRATVALGNTRTNVDINGNTVITPQGQGGTSFNGGLLTQPSNIGHYELNKFSVVPEVTARLGVQVTDNLRVYVGYNFLYWSNVLRPEGVVDMRVNGSQIPPRANQVGTLYPQFTARYTDFWAHGVMFGLQLRY